MDTGERIGHGFVGVGTAFLVIGLVALVLALTAAHDGLRAFLLCVAVPLTVSGLRLRRLGHLGLRA